MRSYLAAQVSRGRTMIAWVWDVYDRDQQRALRLSGEEPAGKAGRDAWAAADDLVLAENRAGRLERPQRHDQRHGAGGSPPAPRAGRRGPAVASAERIRPLRTHSASARSAIRARLTMQIAAGQRDFAQENRMPTGCQPRRLLDITSLVETRRFRGYLRC